MSREAVSLDAAAITPASFRRAERPASGNGMARVAARAVASAAASAGVRFRGGNVVSTWSAYPPLGPGWAHIGTPASCSASKSRSMVRVLTSKRAASSAARIMRGARVRSSSTRAYRRSVRFMARTIPRMRDNGMSGFARPGMRPGSGHWLQYETVRLPYQGHEQHRREAEPALRPRCSSARKEVSHFGHVLVSNDRSYDASKEFDVCDRDICHRYTRSLIGARTS